MNLSQYCPSGAAYCSTINALTSNIINPSLLLLSGAALIIFLWGIVEFLIALSHGEKGTGEGKQHMLWGMIGMFVILSAFGIFSLLSSTVSSFGQ